MPADIEEAIRVYDYIKSTRARGARRIEIKMGANVLPSVVDTILFCGVSEGKMSKTRIKSNVFYNLTAKGLKYLEDIKTDGRRS